jgi:hypothetical protein
MTGRIPIGGEDEEFLRHVAAGADAGAFVFVDEIAKQKAIEKILPARLLLLTRGTRYRALYIGSRLLPPLPVVVLADTVVPPIMRSDVQLARRIVEVDLGAGINVTGQDWRKTCGTGDIKGWRSASEDNARAADIFVSDVIRNYCDADFKVIAAKLGFKTFRDSAGDFDATADYRAFFDAVCAAPEVEDGHIKGRGYKLIDAERRETPIECTFHAIGEQGVCGAQWGRILQVPGVVCDFQRHRKKAFVRFRLGGSRMLTTKFNAEILPSVTTVAPTVAPVAPASRPPSRPLSETSEVDMATIFTSLPF